MTSTGSGLAVPDWPLSYGGLFPPMVGGIFYEHGHRMVAGVVAVLMTILAIWLMAREQRVWVRRLGLAALAVIIAQAVLGGITVLFMLPTAVSVAHACLAQTFFCLTVTLALVTSRGWKAAESGYEGTAAGGRAARRETAATQSGLVALGTLTTSAVFSQLAIGALMRHTGSGLAIPDFPLSLGRVIPPLDSPAVAINFAHRVGAMLVAACAGWTVASVLRKPRQPALVRPAAALGALVLLQIALGAFTVWSGKAVIPATAHVATGALVLATSLVLTLRAGRSLTLASPVIPRLAGAS